MEKAIETNVHILAYPPHCTHVLQGLDVVCFAKMKRIWNTALDNFEDKHMRGPNKEDFPKLFGEAFLQAFTKETILSAFRVTGIFPFNRAIITEEHIKPSGPTTFTKNTFPQPLPEPIQAVMTAWNNFDLVHEREELMSGAIKQSNSMSITYHDQTLLRPSNEANTGCLHSETITSIEMTQNIKVNTEILLRTPTKRVRFMTHSLAHTSVGRSLLSTDPIDPTTIKILSPIIENKVQLANPKWELLENDLESATIDELLEHIAELTESLEMSKQHIQARDTINAKLQAQLIVQNLLAQKLKVALEEKKKRKSKDYDNTKLFKDGQAKFYTDEAIKERLTEIKEAKEEAQRKKDKQAKLRRAKKLALEARNEAWKAMLETYNAEKSRWKEENEALIKAKVPPRSRPQAPKRPRKPSVAEFEDEVEESSDEDNDDDSVHALTIRVTLSHAHVNQVSA